VAEGLEGTLQFLTDLCHMQAARAAGEVSRICSTLVYGYLNHPAWESGCNGCGTEDELVALEAQVPGASSFSSEYVRADGSHEAKAGPCVQPEGLGDFIKLRSKLDGCLAGSMLARDRAAGSVQKVMIPAALDYPQ
jgi:hypothetical protein